MSTKETMEIRERVYQLHVQETQLEQLTELEEYFVPCNVKKENEEYVFDFEVTKRTSLEKVNKKDKLDCLRLALNIKKLQRHWKKYKFTLNPNNLMFNYSMEPSVLMRDLRKEDDTDIETEFLKQYRCVAGFLLQSKYSYEDYYEGGEVLLEKQSETKVLYGCKSVDEVWQYLYKRLNQEKADEERNVQKVPKRKYIIHKWVERIAIVLLVISLVFVGIMAGRTLPMTETLLQANEAYITNELEKVSALLKDVDIDDIGKSTKYMYALTSISQDQYLSDIQKENARSSVTVSSSEVVYDFWIYLNRSEYQDAVDYAKKIGDDSYLGIAYYEYIEYTKNDTTISGNEKEQLLSQLNQDLQALNQENTTEQQ